MGSTFLYEGKTLKCTSNEKLEELVQLGKDAAHVLRGRTRCIPRLGVVEVEAGKPRYGDAKQ